MAVAGQQMLLYSLLFEKSGASSNKGSDSFQLYMWPQSFIKDIHTFRVTGICQTAANFSKQINHLKPLL